MNEFWEIKNILDTLFFKRIKGTGHKVREGVRVNKGSVLKNVVTTPKARNCNKGGSYKKESVLKTRCCIETLIVI